MRASNFKISQVSSHQIFEEESLEVLNDILGMQGYRIEKCSSLGDYTSHVVYQCDQAIFETIYPKELLIKVAQLLPDSEVRLGRYGVCVGDDDMSQETLNLILN